MKTIRFVLVASLSLTVLAGSLQADSGKLNTSLKFLQNARETGFARTKADQPGLAEALSDNVMVTLKFDHVLSLEEIAALEQGGASFFRIDGAVAHTGPFYAARVPWDSIDGLASRSDVLKLDAAWKPCVYPCLNVSAHDIQADSAWKHLDPLG
ncbi:MAG: hypothetical protein ABR899_02645, partial [Candidatus Krumholzibacteriaceae bacterium]